MCLVSWFAVVFLVCSLGLTWLTIILNFRLEHFVRKNVARCKKVCTRYKMHLALSWTLEGWRPTLVPTVTRWPFHWLAWWICSCSQWSDTAPLLPNLTGMIRLHSKTGWFPLQMAQCRGPGWPDSVIIFLSCFCSGYDCQKQGCIQVCMLCCMVNQVWSCETSRWLSSDFAQEC